MTYACIRWSYFSAPFPLSLHHCVVLWKQLNASVTLWWRFYPFLSFAALMKLDLTCSENVQSKNFAIIWRIISYLFPFALCALSILLVIQSLPNSGITFKISLATISFIMFWDFSMFCQIFLSPQVKPWAIITYKHGIYELPHELPNDLRLLWILGKQEISGKCLNPIEW